MGDTFSEFCLFSNSFLLPGKEILSQVEIDFLSFRLYMMLVLFHHLLTSYVANTSLIIFPFVIYLSLLPKSLSNFYSNHVAQEFYKSILTAVTFLSDPAWNLISGFNMRVTL